MEIADRQFIDRAFQVKSGCICHLCKVSFRVRSAVSTSDADDRAIHRALDYFSVYDTPALLDFQFFFTDIQIARLNLPLLVTDHFFDFFRGIDAVFSAVKVAATVTRIKRLRLRFFLPQPVLFQQCNQRIRIPDCRLLSVT